MNVREIIQEKYPDVRPLWLDAIFDAGLVGVAENHTGQVPIYDWSAAALHLLEQTSPREVFRKIQPMLFQPGADLPVIMMPPARTIFWERVTSGRSMAWELMHACIAGQGYYSFRRKPFVIYDWDAIIVKLTESEKDSKITNTKDQVARAIEFYNTKMKPIDVGEGSPVYWRKL